MLVLQNGDKEYDYLQNNYNKKSKKSINNISKHLIIFTEFSNRAFIYLYNICRNRIRLEWKMAFIK